MLHFYRFKNFQSFIDWTEVNLVLKKQSPYRGWERNSSDEGKRISTAMAVFGANGSGKTAILKPIAFLHWFISSSFSLHPTDEIPVTTSKLTKDDTSQFEVEFEDSNHTIWRYELKASKERVFSESLHKKNPNTLKFSYIFKRNWDEESRSYDVSQQGFGLSQNEARKARQNCSLISTAAQYGVEIALKLTNLNVQYNINVNGRAHFRNEHLDFAKEKFFDNPSIKQKAQELLAKWDLGINEINLNKVSRSYEGDAYETIDADVTHVTSNGSTFSLPINLESSGTQASFVLLSLLLPVLENGGLAIVDEMESDLHPDLIEPITSLFDSEISNPHNAQLVFTSHATKILENLGKHQVIIVEKNDCVSSAYRLDEVRGIRSDDNLRSKYETGALGGTPNV